MSNDPSTGTPKSMADEPRSSSWQPDRACHAPPSPESRLELRCRTTSFPPSTRSRPGLPTPNRAAAVVETAAAVNSTSSQPDPTPPTIMDPEISRFYGIVIRMPAPEGNTVGRFEAHYGATSMVVGLNPLRILHASAPARVRGMVLEWAARQRLELLMAWRQRGLGAVPASIPPLV